MLCTVPEVAQACSSAVVLSSTAVPDRVAFVAEKGCWAQLIACRCCPLWPPIYMCCTSLLVTSPYQPTWCSTTSYQTLLQLMVAAVKLNTGKMLLE